MFLSKLTPRELKSLRHDWSFWARPEQRAPSGNWHTWLILAGRGAGKTRSGAEWVRACACGATPLTGGSTARIALVAETAADGRDVMVEGPSGLLTIHPSAFRPKFEPSKRRLTWRNGTIATRLQRNGPGPTARPAARCSLVRRTRQMALRPRNLGHAAIRAAAGRKPAPGHHHDAAPDPAHPRTSHTRRAWRSPHARHHLQQPCQPRRELLRHHRQAL